MTFLLSRKANPLLQNKEKLACAAMAQNRELKHLLEVYAQEAKDQGEKATRPPGGEGVERWEKSSAGVRPGGGPRGGEEGEEEVEVVESFFQPPEEPPDMLEDTFFHGKLTIEVGPRSMSSGGDSSLFLWEFSCGEVAGQSL